MRHSVVLAILAVVVVPVTLSRGQTRPEPGKIVVRGVAFIQDYSRTSLRPSRAGHRPQSIPP